MSASEPQHTEGHTLLLRLVGPMQSWGFRSRFDNRDSALEPTRSGVIGLLCAALGWGRDSDLAPFQSLKMGVRVDAPGRVMVDYHTAQRVAKAGGGIAGTLQSWRYYLSDARFLVGLQGDDLPFLQGLEDALKNPRWPLFLGRKSFVPSLPIHLPGGGIRAGEVKAVLEGEPWRALWRGDRPTPMLRLLLEDEQGSTVGDVPLDFAARRFGLRSVVSRPLDSAQLPHEEEPCISLN